MLLASKKKGLRTAQVAASELRVSVKTLYRWEQEGWVDPPETLELSPGNDLRIYSKEWVAKAILDLRRRAADKRAARQGRR